jgi:ribose transport system permease protein
MDISLGAMMGLINVIYVTLAMKGLSIPATIIISLLAGVVCGLLNGIFVGLFRITPILTTLATSYIFNGIALFIMPSPKGTVQTELIQWFYGWLDGFGAPLLFLILAIVSWILVKRTKLGMYIYAIGENKECAYASGIPVNLATFSSYAFAGFLYAVAAIAMTTYCSGGDASIADALTMKSIAACVIGGVLLVGGIGDAMGACFGAISLGFMIKTILTIVKSTYFTDFAQGCLMLIAVLGCTLINRYIARKLAGKREVKEDV